MTNHLLNQALETKRAEEKNLVVPYIMAGDGGLDILEERLAFLESCGAAAVELGIPFSDPVADGPVIQDAGQRALSGGTTMNAVLKTLETFQKITIPVVFMTYFNPIYTYGIERFAKDCASAGVSGVIIPDLPLEEEPIITDSLTRYAISHVRLAAMTSPDERLTAIAKRTEGFLYAVSVTGTTGARSQHDSRVKTYLQSLKMMTDAPVLAGFGISSPEQAQDLSSSCDGVIIGSKIVDAFHRGDTGTIKHLIQESL